MQEVTSCPATVVASCYRNVAEPNRRCISSENLIIFPVDVLLDPENQAF